MSAPDIFFLRFENAPWSDPCFMSLGRLLALSQRFESHCRATALHIKVRRALASPLESEKALSAFCNKVWRDTLYNHVAYLSKLPGNVSSLSEAGLFKILDDARNARNEVAHEVTLGFEYWAYDESLSTSQSAGIRELAEKLAHADHLLCTIQSILSNELMPEGDHYLTYPERLVRWVCNTDNGDPW